MREFIFGLPLQNRAIRCFGARDSPLANVALCMRFKCPTFGKCEFHTKRPYCTAGPSLTQLSQLTHPPPFSRKKDEIPRRGVPESHADRILETLAKSIYESCSPPILPQVYFQRIEEKTIVVIEVSPGNQKPYYLKSLGINDGVFIRTGRSTVRATHETSR